MMSDQFYQYLNASSVGSNFTMTINTCQTSEGYSAYAGQRCRYMGSGHWYVRKVSYTKAAHLKLYNTNALSEIFINSDGRPTLGEGSSGCNIQVIGARTGVACRMMNYMLNHNGLNNTSIRFFRRSTIQPQLQSNPETYNLVLTENHGKCQRYNQLLFI